MPPPTTFIIASANPGLFALALIIDRMKLLSKLQEQKPKLFESKETLHNACENIKTKPRWPRPDKRLRELYRAAETQVLS